MQTVTQKIIACMLCWLAGTEAALAVGATGIMVQRDPFRRPGAAAAVKAPAPEAAYSQSPALQLRAIIYNKSRPLANIDGNIVEVGATVYDYRVVLVKEQEVTLEKDGNRFALSLDKAGHQ